MIDTTQVESTYWNKNSKILLLHYYQRPGNPHYQEYKKANDGWRKLPSMKLVDHDTTLILNGLWFKKVNKKAYEYNESDPIPKGMSEVDYNKSLIDPRLRPRHTSWWGWITNFLR